MNHTYSNEDYLRILNQKVDSKLNNLTAEFDKEIQQLRNNIENGVNQQLKSLTTEINTMKLNFTNTIQQFLGESQRTQQELISRIDNHDKKILFLWSEFHMVTTNNTLNNTLSWITPEFISGNPDFWSQIDSSLINITRSDVNWNKFKRLTYDLIHDPEARQIKLHNNDGEINKVSIHRKHFQTWRNQKFIFKNYVFM